MNNITNKGTALLLAIFTLATSACAPSGRRDANGDQMEGFKGLPYYGADNKKVVAEVTVKLIDADGKFVLGEDGKPQQIVVKGGDINYGMTRVGNDYAPQYDVISNGGFTDAQAATGKVFFIGRVEVKPVGEQKAQMFYLYAAGAGAFVGGVGSGVGNILYGLAAKEGQLASNSISINQEGQTTSSKANSDSRSNAKATSSSTSSSESNPTLNSSPSSSSSSTSSPKTTVTVPSTPSGKKPCNTCPGGWTDSKLNVANPKLYAMNVRSNLTVKRGKAGVRSAYNVG
jgi:hypothetical protein